MMKIWLALVQPIYFWWAPGKPCPPTWSNLLLDNCNFSHFYFLFQTCHTKGFVFLLNKCKNHLLRGPLKIKYLGVLVLFFINLLINIIFNLFIYIILSFSLTFPLHPNPIIALPCQSVKERLKDAHNLRLFQFVWGRSCQPWFFSSNIILTVQNHSWTCNKCFAFGLDCLLLIKIWYFDYFESHHMYIICCQAMRQSEQPKNV